MADVRQAEAAARSPRKFAVEHVETTTKSNRPAKSSETKEEAAKPVRRFAPQPVETSTKSNRRNGPGRSPKQDPSSAPATPPAESARKFAPQLIETTTRTRKRGDTVPPSRQLTDKTDLSPGDAFHLPRHMRIERPSALPIAPENSPVATMNQVPQSKFSAANLARRQPRRTSMRTPHLEPIESDPNSDESSPSNVPSLSTTPSAASEHPDMHNHVSRLRESCDDRFSGYLLALAARVAEQQLKEQAMAAYPNETMHEQVDHFVNVERDSDDNDDDEEGFGMLPREDEPAEAADRRESAAGWDIAEMRKHQASLEQQRQQYKQREEASRRSPPAQTPFKSPFGALPDIAPAKAVNGGQTKKPNEDPKQLHSASSPPMLGKDLVFPSCPSPKQTMIDPTQRPCRQGSKDTGPSRQHSGLWTPAHSAAPTPKNLSRKASSSGLWHGVCQSNPSSEHNSLAPPSFSTQSGLMTPAVWTPAVEQPDPFASFGNKHQLPSTPPPINGNGGDVKILGIDDALSVEANLDTEYPDSFITQVYNYLSLGYPALARAYDDELSKISKVPLRDIRRDDARRNTKGYVGAPEGEGCSEEEVKEACGRWRALRLYVREWGRQEGRMVRQRNGLPEGAWGRSARRGSWAI